MPADANQCQAVAFIVIFVKMVDITLKSPLQITQHQGINVSAQQAIQDVSVKMRQNHVMHTEMVLDFLEYTRSLMMT